MKSKEQLEAERRSLISKYVRIAHDMYLLDVGGEIDSRLESLINGKASTAIKLLQSEYRKRETLDSWRPLEIALFVAGITRFGRDWEALKSILPQKSAPEMSDFYYSVWKGTKPYFSWKRIRKQRGLE